MTASLEEKASELESEALKQPAAIGMPHATSSGSSVISTGPGQD
jgi:hypothetical protein